MKIKVLDHFTLGELGTFREILFGAPIKSLQYHHCPRPRTNARKKNGLFVGRSERLSIKWIILLFFSVIFSVLLGCGQSGHLYLPEQTTTTEKA